MPVQSLVRELRSCMSCGMAKKKERKKERNWWAGFFVQTGERLELMKMDVIRKVPQKAMASHSSILAWKIPWTEGSGGLQSMGSLRVRHD